MASMIAAIESFAQQGAQMVTAVGAKTAEQLLFVERGTRAEKPHRHGRWLAGSPALCPLSRTSSSDRHKFDLILTCGPNDDEGRRRPRAETNLPVQRASSGT